MEEKRYLFEKEKVSRALFKMALPTIISQLILLIYNLADTWFIGRTNNPYMVASCSLVLPAFMLTIVITNVFGSGGGTLLARLIGRGEDEEASRVSAACIDMAFATALIYVLVCFFLMDKILLLLGASGNTLGYSKQYMLLVVVIGGIPAILSNTLSTMLRSIGMSSQASFGLSMGGVLNIALDPLFMFVILPDGQQVLGAGIATMLSNVVSFIYFVIIYVRACKTTILRFSLLGGVVSGLKSSSVGRSGLIPSKASFASIFSVGIPAGVSVLLFDLCNIVINRLSAGYGDIELAAIGIVLKAERLPLNIGIGICLGMVPLVAYSYSSGNRERMDDIFRFGRLTGLSIAIVCVVLYYIFAPWIMRGFIGDPETVRFGTQFLRARCFATPVMFLCFSMVHFMQAVGKGKEAFILAVIRQLVFNIPLLFLFEHLFGMMGIVWTQATADLGTTIASYIIYFRTRREEGWPRAL